MKYSLRKLPSSTKGAYSFDAATFKKRKNSTKLRDDEDPNKPSKNKLQSKIPIEQLATGKDLKKVFAHLPKVQEVVVPMGSNFDKLEPDTGVVLEERGRSKKG